MHSLKPAPCRLRFWLFVLAAACSLISTRLSAATAVVYTNDFESYTSVATSAGDTSDADPVGAEWKMTDDTALSPTTAGAGVQVINWLTNSAGLPTKCLLVQPATEANIYLLNARSGSRYQIDFQVLINRGPTSSKSFFIVLQGLGADFNGSDFLSYRTDRATNSTKLFLYDGVRTTPAWVNIGAHTTQWQHHRLVVDNATQMVSVYVDDMVTPITSTGRLARSEVAVPTYIRIINEGDSADDGWFALDDFGITCDDAVDLTTTFTEGFEGYTARTVITDDADPAGPWITTETDGINAAGGRPAAPGKVQVVAKGDTIANIIPHSGNKCLKIEAGQRAGVSLGWGLPPKTDVQVTWWACVPQVNTAQPTTASGELNYLRMSLYGAEGGSTYANDCALLGYGIRTTTPPLGGVTSLTYYLGSAWVDTTFTYTPNVWEEYRLTTHNAQGKYTIVKNPSSATPTVVVDRAPFVGSASTWGPTLVAGWSSSNGTNHPPVYVDDIEVKSLVSNPDPLPTPYTVQFDGTRFTNVSTLNLGVPVGSVAVDPRDSNTIVFAVDSTPGGIYQAKKVASGNWLVDPTALVTGLDRPSGMTIDANGTIWWVHDYTMTLMRLKAPWTSNTPERLIVDFGTAAGGIDDDPFDVCIAPAGFNGSIGKPGQVLIVDRGVDGDAYNAVLWVDPTISDLDQTNYANYLVAPTSTELGNVNMVCITPVPALNQVATLCVDGQISLVDPNGTITKSWPDIYPDPTATYSPVSIAADPTTGRLWLSDDLSDKVYSMAADSLSSSTPTTVEFSFPLTNPSRTDQQIYLKEPGMTFSPDGAFLVLSDGSTANGGGRLLILHNEPIVFLPFNLSIAKITEGYKLTWNSAGAAKYRVQRSNTLVASDFVDVSVDLISTSYTVTNSVTTPVYYRVIAKP